MLNEDRPIEMPYVALEVNLITSLKKLTDEQRSRFLMAVLSYGNNESVDLSDDLILDILFDRFVNFTEKYRKEYIAKIKRSRENGKKGGRPKQNPQVISENLKNPQVISENLKNPQVISETQKTKVKVNETKLNKVSCKDTLFSNSTEVSQSGFPDGHPTGKPEYRELRRYARIILGEDDAYFCDDFKNAVENYDDDWSDWQNRMKRFAVKQGRLDDV